MVEIIKSDGIEYVVKIEQELVISSSEYREFTEKLEELLNQYRL